MLKQVWLYKSIAVLHLKNWIVCYRTVSNYTGADPWFQDRGGGALKKWHRVEGGTKFFGVFRVKNHDFMPKNHIFSNFKGGACQVCPPPGSAPAIYAGKNDSLRYCILYSASIKCCDIFIYLYFWKHLFIYITYRVGLLCCIYCSTIFDKNLKIQNLFFLIFVVSKLIIFILIVYVFIYVICFCF